MNKDIVITLKNNTTVIWMGDEYDDYSYEGPVFVIKFHGEWIGVYNMNEVICVEVGFSGNEELINENN